MDVYRCFKAFSKIEKVAAKPTDECAPIRIISESAPSSVTFGDSFPILGKPWFAGSYHPAKSKFEKFYAPIYNI